MNNRNNRNNRNNLALRKRLNLDLGNQSNQSPFGTIAELRRNGAEWPQNLKKNMLRD